MEEFCLSGSLVVNERFTYGHLSGKDVYMDNFVYNTPTKVVFGRGTELQVGKLVKEQGASKVLIHYGSGSVVRSGLLDRVKGALTEAGVAFVELGGVVPNPRLSLVHQGIELGRRENVDFVLSVGGGSVIDSSKAIGYGLANEGEVWDFFGKKRNAAACTPNGAILTIAAAGSEMSRSCVITNDEVTPWEKKGYSSDLSRCKFAILNPELTMTLPEYQTMSGCTDIMMHTMERYFNQTPENMELTDGFSEHLIRTVMKNALILMKEPDNYNARAEVMWASSLSHNGLTGCGTDGGDWSTHQLEHELGASFDVTHGAGLAAVWGSWARYVWKYRPERFLQFARNVMQVEEQETEEATILAGICAMEDFYRAIHMPTNLKELGIPHLTEEELDGLAYRCGYEDTRTVGMILKLGRQEMADIYRMAQEI